MILVWCKGSPSRRKHQTKRRLFAPKEAIMSPTKRPGATRKGAETDADAATALLPRGDHRGRCTPADGDVDTGRCGCRQRPTAMSTTADVDEPSRLAPRRDQRCRLVTEDTRARNNRHEHTYQMIRASQCGSGDDKDGSRASRRRHGRATGGGPTPPAAAMEAAAVAEGGEIIGRSV